MIVNEDRSGRPTNDLGYLHKLLHTLFGEEEEDDENNHNKDKQAILTHGVSTQSTIWMHDLVGYFLAGKLPFVEVISLPDRLLTD